MFLPLHGMTNDCTAQTCHCWQPSTQTATKAASGGERERERDRHAHKRENKNNEGQITGGCGGKESNKKMRENFRMKMVQEGTGDKKRHWADTKKRNTHNIHWYSTAVSHAAQCSSDEGLCFNSAPCSI